MKELNSLPNTMVHLENHNSKLGPIELFGFKEHCFVYMVELVCQIKSRFDHKDEKLKATLLLDPEILLGGKRGSIVFLTS